MSRYAGYNRGPNETPYFSNVLMPPSKDEQVIVKRLFIDNRDRYDPANTSPFDFKIYFGNDLGRSVGISGYENVTSVELKAVSFPKVVNERYIVVSIDELNDNMLDASNSGTHNAFAIVYFDSDLLPTGTVKPFKGTDFYQKQLLFRPPLAKLNNLSIKFLKHPGNVISTSDTNNETHISMMLEITTKVNR